MSTVKNANRYSRLVDVCTGYGGRFNPGHSTLKLNAMRALLEKAQSSLQDVKLTQTGYNNATNQREVTFGEIQRLATEVVRMLKASGATAQTLKDANLFLRLVKGRRAAARAPISSTEANVAETPGRIRSFTHQSYVSIADNFARLVHTVEAQPQYKPNEARLQVPTLKATISKALTQMEDVETARTAWSNARLKRNEMLYRTDKALYHTAMAVKQYAGAVFGLQSEEYRQVSRIRFTKPIK